MSFLIADAYAAPAAQDASGGIAGMLMPVLLLVVFYFLLIRPQQKRQKEQLALIGSLKKGDEVAFAGGLLGRIRSVDDDYAVIELSDSMTVKVQKASIIASLPAGTLKGIGVSSGANLSKD